jgi:hypothetical protein
MGLFICFKKESKYKNDLHSEIENSFVTRYGYTTITQEECNRIYMLTRKSNNERGETFCKYVDEKGELHGVDMATLAGHTSGYSTVLILSTRDNFSEIESADDVRAILAFDHEEEDDDNKKYELSINVLCSNQITKSGGARILLTNLIDVSRENGIRLISLAAAETAITYYEKFGFRIEPGFKSFMSLQLGGNRMVHLVLNLKTKKLKTKKLKTKKLKTKKLKTKKLKTKKLKFGSTFSKG